MAQGQLCKHNVFQARFPSTPKSTRFAKVPRKSTGHKPSVRWWSEPLLGLLKCGTTSRLAPLPKLANLGCNLAGLSVLVEPKSYEQEWGATRGKTVEKLGSQNCHHIPTPKSQRNLADTVYPVSVQSCQIRAPGTRGGRDQAQRKFGRAGGGKPPGPEVPRDIARTGNSHAGTQGLKLALNVSAGQDCKGRGRGLEI